MQFAVEVQWNPGTWTDESAYVRRVKTWAGLAGPGDSVAAIGRCTVELDNGSGRFSPEASAALAGLVLPRKEVRVSASDGVTNWVLWRGFIDAIVPEAGDLARRCVLECVDGVALLDHQRISVEHAASKAVDEAVSEVVAAAYTPPALAIADNGDSLDHYGHTWQPETTRAVDALRAICESVYGRFWVARDGTATFQTRDQRQDPSAAAVWYVGAAAPVPTYAQKVLSYEPFAYWKLSQVSGTTVVDSSGNGFDGAAYGVTWGSAGIGDGNTAALLDGVNDYIDVFSAGLAAAFDAATGTISLWVKMANWDTAYSNIVEFGADGNNRVGLWQVPDGFAGQYLGAGVFRQSTWDGETTDWVHLAFTWDSGANRLQLFVDGVAQTPGTDALTVLSGVNLAHLGASVMVGGPSHYHPGGLAHVALFDSVLSAEAIVDLAGVEA